MPNQNPLTSTTQVFLDIHDITNDLLIMKDGATSLILTVSAMNFGLLAEEEQDAIIYSYAGLLNSLNYPIQIVIRSQTKDATKYLNLLKEQEEQASTEAKRQAIANYGAFVSNLIRERNVLDKKFYVVIPANALEMGLLPPQTVVPGIKSIDINTIERSVILEKARNILEPKRDHLMGQFNRIGLFARQLNTQEIIQLFYTSYNPEAAEGQQLTDTANYTTPLVGTQVPVMPLAMQATQAQSVPAPAAQQVSPTFETQQPVIAQPPTMVQAPVEQVPQPQPAPIAPPVAQPVMTQPIPESTPVAPPIVTPTPSVTPPPALNVPPPSTQNPVPSAQPPTPVAQPTTVFTAPKPDLPPAPVSVPNPTPETIEPMTLDKPEPLVVPPVPSEPPAPEVTAPTTSAPTIEPLPPEPAPLVVPPVPSTPPTLTVPEPTTLNPVPNTLPPAPSTQNPAPSTLADEDPLPPLPEI